MPLNFSDKSIWGSNASSGFGLNNINQAIFGQLGTVLSAISGQPSVYGSSDDPGKRIWVPQNEIAKFTYATNGTLFGGMYQAVKVDPSATAGNVAVGKVAYLLDSTTTTTGEYMFVVTDEAHATSTAIPVGVFLNTIAPGNYGVIFAGGGKINVLFKAGITNGTPAIGDNVVAGGGTGFVDDASAKTVAPTGLALGTAITAPASSTISPIWIKSPLGIW